MKESFDRAFELVIGLEGNPTYDPRDPGGFTIWGLASRYNPGVGPGTTLAQAKEVYRNKYWSASGCDEVPYPMDICLFDAAVNPQDAKAWQGAGNKELLSLSPENWQEFLLLRMVRYMDNSKPEYVKGHVFRVLKLFRQLKGV